MNRLRAIVLLWAIVNPFGVDAGVLIFLGAGSGPGSGGGGGSSCSTATLSLNACLTTGMIL